MQVRVRAKVRLLNVTKGKVTRIKKKYIFRACDTWFIVTFARRIQKSKPFCNLSPRKSTTKKGQVNPRPHKVKFSNWYFRLKNGYFWKSLSLISGFQKFHFYFCAMFKNAQNRSLSKRRHQRIRFLSYMQGRTQGAMGAMAPFSASPTKCHPRWYTRGVSDIPHI